MTYMMCHLTHSVKFLGCSQKYSRVWHMPRLSVSYNTAKANHCQMLSLSYLLSYIYIVSMIFASKNWIACHYIAGVLISSRQHRENLLLSMLDGRKKAEANQAITTNRPFVALLMLASLVGFWLWSFLA